MSSLTVRALIVTAAALVYAGPGIGAPACEPTLPLGGTLKPPLIDSEGWYGSDALAVLLPPHGQWWGMGPRHRYRDKLFWWHRGFMPGDEPNFNVSGRRLDGAGEQAIIAKVTNAGDDATGGWLILSMIEFPAPGCWELSGRYLDQQLRFVVEVRRE